MFNWIRKNVWPWKEIEQLRAENEDLKDRLNWSEASKEALIRYIKKED